MSKQNKSIPLLKMEILLNIETDEIEILFKRGNIVTDCEELQKPVYELKEELKKVAVKRLSKSNTYRKEV